MTIGAINKDIKCNESFADNHGHKILWPLDIWLNFPFITSETMRYY